MPLPCLELHTLTTGKQARYLQMPPMPLFEPIHNEVVQKLVQQGKVQNISITIWAMATMKVECPGLVNVIEGDAERIMRDGNSEVVSNIACALADLGYFEKGVFDAVAGQVEKVAREGNEQHLCNILWSLAVAWRMKENERAVEVLWKEVNRRDPIDRACKVSCLCTHSRHRPDRVAYHLWSSLLNELLHDILPIDSACKVSRLCAYSRHCPDCVAYLLWLPLPHQRLRHLLSINRTRECRPL